MLLRQFVRTEVSFPPCRPGQVDTVTITAELGEDISAVFPYLNAICRGTTYDPQQKTLSYSDVDRGITLYPARVLVAGSRSRSAAEAYLEKLKNFINHTYERRHEITPSYKIRSKLRVLDIYQLLPKTNCKKCSQPTCMSFAMKLLNEEVQLDACPLLSETEYAGNWTKLCQLFDAAGYEVHRS